MVEVNDNSIIYKNMLYSIVVSDNEKNGGYVSFFPIPESSFEVKVNLDKDSMEPIYEILMNNNLSFQKYNIMNFFYLLRMTDTKLDCSFFTYDENNKPIFRVFLKACETYTKPLILNLDFATGLCLTVLTKSPIRMVKEEFEKKSILKK